MPDRAGGEAPGSTIRIRFGAFTFLSVVESSDGIVVPEAGWASDGLWMIRLSRVRLGDARGFGLPELIHCSSDAARLGLDAFLPVLVLAFPASSVGEIAAKADVPALLAGPCGALVRNHLMLLRTILPPARDGDIRIIAEATAGLLSACLARTAAPEIKGRFVDPSVRRGEVERVIRRNISSARLDPARISALVGMSRSALYRLFGDTGGVAGRVRSLRLEMIRDDLANPALAHKSITEIARMRGLHCASSFGRSFREAFGQTPSEVRAKGIG